VLKALWDKQVAEMRGRFAAYAKDPTFRDAVMAISALVAGADGEVEEAEKKKIRGFIDRSPDLKIFDSLECIRSFNNFVEEMEFDFGMGEDKAFKAVDRLVKSGDAEKLNNAMRLAVAVARSDGTIEPEELVVLKKIADRFGLNIKDYVPE
jgi:tellurite resistance protein TerB